MIAHDPALVMDVFRYLRGIDPKLGLFGGCCAYPTAALGSEKRFSRYRDRLTSGFRTAGVRRLIVCCPNCSEIFRKFGDLEILSVWQVLEAHPPKVAGVPDLPRMVLHDPCPTRGDAVVQAAVRRVLGGPGVHFEEYPDNRAHACCCGNAGMLMVLDPEKSREILMRRVSQSDRRDVLTYCFACADSFRSAGCRSVHGLELLFSKNGSFCDRAGTRSVWLNRWRMARRIGQLQKESG